ncbi:hypothetical protein CAS74_001557 [Pichia kudriavzevii]|uniref:Uncharacterized protein n=1 Tax=Pichia kudriavzevii TaxID=4909 RepID=A0A1Z8JRQ0_PICKU|nr:hypothetical protein CAS74_001557 [Pichia kudriavzevii]
MALLTLWDITLGLLALLGYPEYALVCLQTSFVLEDLYLFQQRPNYSTLLRDDLVTFVIGLFLKVCATYLKSCASYWVCGLTEDGQCVSAGLELALWGFLLLLLVHTGISRGWWYNDRKLRLIEGKGELINTIVFQLTLITLKLYIYSSLL